MLQLTNPILEEIRETDNLLIRTYRKVARTLQARGDANGFKCYLRKMFKTYEHLKLVQQEIDLNEREAGAERPLSESQD